MSWKELVGQWMVCIDDNQHGAHTCSPLPFSHWVWMRSSFLLRRPHDWKLPARLPHSPDSFRLCTPQNRFPPDDGASSCYVLLPEHEHSVQLVSNTLDPKPKQEKKKFKKQFQKKRMKLAQLIRSDSLLHSCKKTLERTVVVGKDGSMCVCCATPGHGPSWKASLFERRGLVVHRLKKR